MRYLVYYAILIAHLIAPFKWTSASINEQHYIQHLYDSGLYVDYSTKCYLYLTYGSFTKNTPFLYSIAVESSECALRR